MVSRYLKVWLHVRMENWSVREHSMSWKGVHRVLLSEEIGLQNSLPYRAPSFFFGKNVHIGIIFKKLCAWLVWLCGLSTGL